MPSSKDELSWEADLVTYIQAESLTALYLRYWICVAKYCTERQKHREGTKVTAALKDRYNKRFEKLDSETVQALKEASRCKPPLAQFKSEFKVFTKLFRRAINFARKLKLKFDGLRETGQYTVYKMNDYKDLNDSLNVLRNALRPELASSSGFSASSRAKALTCFLFESADLDYQFLVTSSEVNAQFAQGQKSAIRKNISKLKTALDSLKKKSSKVAYEEIILCMKELDELSNFQLAVLSIYTESDRIDVAQAKAKPYVRKIPPQRELYEKAMASLRRSLLDELPSQHIARSV